MLLKILTHSMAGCVTFCFDGCFVKCFQHVPPVIGNIVNFVGGAFSLDMSIYLNLKPFCILGFICVSCHYNKLNVCLHLP